MFTSWDGYYFSTIAVEGYADAESPELLEAYAFFPLYPMLMRLLAEACKFLSMRCEVYKPFCEGGSAGGDVV